MAIYYPENFFPWHRSHHRDEPEDRNGIEYRSADNDVHFANPFNITGKSSAMPRQQPQHFQITVYSQLLREILGTLAYIRQSFLRGIQRDSNCPR